MTMMVGKLRDPTLKELENLCLDAGEIQHLQMSFRAPNVRSRWEPKRTEASGWSNVEGQRRVRNSKEFSITVE